MFIISNPLNYKLKDKLKNSTKKEIQKVKATFYLKINSLKMFDIEYSTCLLVLYLLNSI